MTKNDDKILALQTKVEEKRAAIGTKPRFNPVTNCSLTLNGARFNLHTLSRPQAVDVLVAVNVLRMSAQDLKLDLRLDGFSVNDWITDLKTRIGILDWSAEKKKLSVLEAQLEQLLSNDKQTEIKIDKIAALIDGD